jgi:hypothetical protein
MFTTTLNLQIARQIQSDRASRVERHRRVRRARRSADEQANGRLGDVPVNVVLLRPPRAGTAVTTRVA